MNPYAKLSKQKLLKLQIKFSLFHKKMEKKLEELIEDDYLHQMQYIAHFETEYMTPVRQMLNKQPTRWGTSR